MLKHSCSECGAPLPDAWRPVGMRTCTPVCPACAVKHMQAKSSRRHALANLRHKGRAPLAAKA